jgi:hypothetical protein
MRKADHYFFLKNNCLSFSSFFLNVEKHYPYFLEYFPARVRIRSNTANNFI